MVYKSAEGMRAVRERVESLAGNLPFQSESRHIESKEFGRTHCLEAGDREKPVMLLLHGSSSNSLSWGGYMGEWAGDYHLFALDMPGQPGLSGPERPNLDRMSSWLEECVRSLGLDCFFLCGMSLGSWLGLRYAWEYPERVEKLALITISGITPPRVSFFLRILPLMLCGKAGARRIGRIVSGPVKMDRAAEDFGLLVSRNFIPLMDPIPLFADEELAGLKCPVYYAGGSRDALLNTETTSDRLRQHVANLKISLMPGTGHVILDRAGEIGNFFTSY